MRQILVVDDDEQCLRLIQTALSQSGNLTCVKYLAEAKQLIERTNFDLILLDVTLTDGDGFAYCATLQNDKRTAHIPVILITGMTGTTSKVLGYSVGADDYVEKPFNFLELRARVENKLSKYHGKIEQKEEFRLGDLEVSCSSHKAFLLVEGQRTEISLTPIEFKILASLIKNVDRTLSRENLLNMVWGQDINIVDRTIDKHISSLRRKLGTCSGYLQTSTGFGYMLSIPETIKKSA